MHKEIKHQEQEQTKFTYTEQTPTHEDLRSWKVQTQTIKHSV